MDNIDRQIAEKVMGWTFTKVDGTTSYWRNHLTDKPRKGLPQAIYFDGQWNPSINIAHAFEVVEKLKTIGHSVYIYCHGDVEKTEINVLTETGNTILVDLTADTPAMAICLAALEVVKGKEDG